MSSDTTLGVLGRGVVAGAVGTAAMTIAQTVYYKACDAEPSSAPAEAAKRIIRGVLQREVPEDKTGTLNNAMHWLYGTGWGVLYGLAARRPSLGIAFGALVWAASMVELPALKLSPPAWQMPPSSIPPELGFHLVYGTAVAATHRALS